MKKQNERQISRVDSAIMDHENLLRDIADKSDVDLTTKQKVWRIIKFCIAEGSAGGVQFISFAILFSGIFRHSSDDTSSNIYWVCYLIAVTLSVLWSFTFNRKFTFKSVANIKIAMLKVIAYYAVFIPISTLWSNKWAAAWGVKPSDDNIYAYIILGITMLINGITEYLYYVFVVYRGTMNTSASGQKDLEKARNSQ